MIMRLWLIAILLPVLALPARADDIRREELEQMEVQTVSELPPDDYAGENEGDIAMAGPQDYPPAPEVPDIVVPPLSANNAPPAPAPRPSVIAPNPTPRAEPPATTPPPPSPGPQPVSRSANTDPAPRNTYTVTPAPAQYPTQHPGSLAEYFSDNYRLRFDYGGWLFSTFANYTNPDHSGVHVNFKDAASHQVRLYGKLTTEAGSTAYLRLRGSYTDINTRTGYVGIGSDFAGPAVDLAYWRWSPEIPQFLTPTPQHSMAVTLGRQFFRLGRGLAYANRMDGGKLDYHTAWWDFSLFALRTVPGTDNIDPTVPGAGRSAHNALGFTIDYTGFRDHRLYLFYANTSDFSREFPNDDFQEYDYAPVHIGLGATGQARAGLKYWFEFINETGWSYSSGSEHNRERIHAHSYDIGLQQFFPAVAGRPSVLLQYMSATGDGDRFVVPGARGGNLTGSNDNAFSYFGYAPLGLAWDPQLTNLEVTKVGASIQPLRFFGLADHDATLTLAYLRFERNRPDGVISDWSAVPPDKMGQPSVSAGNTHLGNEVDLSLAAAICPGTSVSTSFGYFRPGQGFIDIPGTNIDYRRPARYFSFGFVQEF